MVLKEKLNDLMNEKENGRLELRLAKKNWPKLEKLKKAHPESEEDVAQKILVLLKEFNIKPEAYYGGDLNGVCCHQLMHDSEKSFERIRGFLLSAVNDDILQKWEIKKEEYTKRQWKQLMNTATW